MLTITFWFAMAAFIIGIAALTIGIIALVFGVKGSNRSKRIDTELNKNDEEIVGGADDESEPDINHTADALKKQGYDVQCFETKEDAVSYLDQQLDGATIGIGGSQTVAQMGLYDALAVHNTVYWHDHKPEDLSIMETRQMASRSPVYISSVNGMSEDGDIINIDGTGNRVAAISFGPEDIYFVVGKNKIAHDYEAAMFRARNVAAPLNAKRLNRKTPCAAKGDRCFDCKSPDRICNNFVVFRRMPGGARYHVILISENLGY